jgi:hypothetical protein
MLVLVVSGCWADDETTAPVDKSEDVTASVPSAKGGTPTDAAESSGELPVAPPSSSSGAPTKKATLVWEALELPADPISKATMGYAWAASENEKRLYVAVTNYTATEPSISYGRLLGSQDGGATWTQHDRWYNPNSMILGVTAIPGSTTVIAVGAGSYDAATDQYKADVSRNLGGSLWYRAGARFGGVFEAVWASGPDDIYAVGYKGTTRGPHTGVVWHSTDSGNIFMPVRSAEIDKLQEIRGVWGNGPGEVYVAGNGSLPGGAVLRSLDRGKTWTPVLRSATSSSSFWTPFGVPAKSLLFATAYDGALFRSEDSGKTWSSQKLAGIWGGVWGDGETFVLAGKTPAGSPTLHVSGDGGSTWEIGALPASVGGIGALTSVSASATNVVVTGGGRTSKPILVRARR